MTEPSPISTESTPAGTPAADAPAVATPDADRSSASGAGSSQSEGFATPEARHADDGEALIRVVDLHRQFEVGTTKIHVLKGVNLAVQPGEMLVIVGRSGTGKSTLLHNMGLLDTPTSGQILFQGEDLARLNVERQSAVRNRHFGFVFQFYHLLPEFTALENVLMPLMIHHGPLPYWRQRRQIRDRAKELLDRLGLSHRLTHRPSQLSGGERQRVAMARALINRPAIVFCDEPTGNLDSRTAQEIHEQLVELNQGPERQTFAIVTHNYALAQLGSRVLHMKDGVFVDASEVAAG